MSLLNHLRELHEQGEGKEEALRELAQQLKEVYATHHGYAELAQGVMQELTKKGMKPEYRVGDKVIADGQYEGLVGKVVNSRTEDSGLMYGVEWNKKVNDTITCHDHARRGYGAYLSPSALGFPLPEDKGGLETFLTDVVERIADKEEEKSGEGNFAVGDRVKLKEDAGQNRKGAYGLVESKRIELGGGDTTLGWATPYGYEILFDNAEKKTRISEKKLIAVHDRQGTVDKVEKKVLEVLNRVMRKYGGSPENDEQQQLQKGMKRKLRQYGFEASSIARFFEEVNGGNIEEKITEHFRSNGRKSEKERYVDFVGQQVERVRGGMRHDYPSLAKELHETVKGKIPTSLPLPAKEMDEKGYQTYKKELQKAVAGFLDKEGKGAIYKGHTVRVKKSDERWWNGDYRTQRDSFAPVGSIVKVEGVHDPGGGDHYRVQWEGKKWVWRNMHGFCVEADRACFLRSELEKIVPPELEQLVQNEATRMEGQQQTNSDKAREVLLMTIPQLAEFGFSREWIQDYFHKAFPTMRKEIDSLTEELVPLSPEEIKTKTIAKIVVELDNAGRQNNDYRQQAAMILERVERANDVVLRNYCHVGERVVVKTVGDYAEKHADIAGLEGKIVDFRDGKYGVEFPKHVKDGKSCHGKAKEGRGLYLKYEDLWLKPIENENEYQKFLDDMVENIVQGERLVFGERIELGNRVKLLKDEGKRKSGMYGQVTQGVWTVYHGNGYGYGYDYKEKEVEVCRVQFDNEENDIQIPTSTLARVERQNTRYTLDAARQLVERIAGEVEKTQGENKKVDALFLQHLPTLRELGFSDEQIIEGFDAFVPNVRGLVR